MYYIKAKYVKNKQIEKDEKIMRTYKAYLSHRNTWRAFEELRDATSNFGRWTLPTNAAIDMNDDKDANMLPPLDE